MSLPTEKPPLADQSLEEPDSQKTDFREFRESDALVKALPLTIRNRSGYKWAILIGLVAHGGLLLLPMPQGWLNGQEPEQSLEIIPEESGVIAVTTLPIVAQPEPEVVAPAVSIEPIKPPEITAQPQAPLTEVPDSVSAELLEDKSENNLEDEPETTEDESDNLPEDDSSPDDSNNQPEAGIAIPFNDDFPHFEGAQSGCYGLNNCLSVEGETFRDIAKEIRQRLENQGYELTIHDNGDTSGGNHRIYEMRSLEQPEIKYLNIFGEGLTGGFYIITPNIITKDDLETLEINS